jgi:hypothetical protein
VTHDGRHKPQCSRSAEINVLSLQGTPSMY